MNLGFYYHTPYAIREGKQVYVPSYIGVFIESLAESLDKIYCFFHRDDNSYEANYLITRENVVFISIGTKQSSAYRLFFSKLITYPLKKYSNEIDAMLIRGPSILLPAFSKVFKPKPAVVMLVGNQLKGIDSLPQPLWRKALIKLMWQLNQKKQERVVKSSLLLVNSDELLKEYVGKAYKLGKIETSTIMEKDFFEREDTCKGRLIKLLYTGRYDISKGILDLVDVLKEIRQKEKKVVLCIAGWSPKGDASIKIFWDKVAQLGLQSYVKDYGYLPIGEELFNVYRQADIYLMPSYREGFPRTIWEAMANSLPVISTNVGGIPMKITSGREGILVPPKNPLKMAAEVIRLIEDAKLRRKIIKNGFAMAKSVTVENTSKKIMAELKSYLEDYKK